MIHFPNAKINLGLRVLRKRNDGFHDIETVMVPIGLSDVLEILESGTGETSLYVSGFDIRPYKNLHLPAAKTSNISESGTSSGSKKEMLTERPASDSEARQNLVIKVYELLKKDYALPPLYIHLHKAIPAGAGLGGGSSDAAFALKSLNELFSLKLTREQLIRYASQVGSDCTFFLENTAAIASGRGEILHPVNISMEDFFIYIIKPDTAVSTSSAYSWVKPSDTSPVMREIISLPVENWKQRLVNDFEKPVFERYPSLHAIKEKLYASGAVYAAMSGSGSAVFGLFKTNPSPVDLPESHFQWIGKC